MSGFSIHSPQPRDPAPTNHRYVLISPDLLGSGSACDPNVSLAEGTQAAKYLPLLNISDWADQLIDLMASNEELTTEQRATIDRWCVVANGGCSPIALQVAEKSMQPNCFLKQPISNVIISSTPRLPFLNSTDPSSKTRKAAYDRLCALWSCWSDFLVVCMSKARPLYSKA